MTENEANRHIVHAFNGFEPPEALQSSGYDRIHISAVYAGTGKLDINPPPGMTHSHMRTLLLPALGYTRTEIAKMTYLSEHTVKTHAAKALGILGVANQLEATIKNFEDGVYVVSEPILMAQTLSPNERWTLQHAVLSQTREQSAQARGVGLSTERYHRRRLFEKLGAVDIVNAVFLGYMSLNITAGSSTSA